MIGITTSTSTTTTTTFFLGKRHLPHKSKFRTGKLNNIAEERM